MDKIFQIVLSPLSNLALLLKFITTGGGCFVHEYLLLQTLDIARDCYPFCYPFFTICIRTFSVIHACIHKYVILQTIY